MIISPTPQYASQSRPLKKSTTKPESSRAASRTNEDHSDHRNNQILKHPVETPR
jgi:hypothetical protein